MTGALFTADTEPDPNLWAMDLDADSHPVSAHLITGTRRNDFGEEVRVAACGQEFTAGRHPCGWWGTRLGQLPLQEHAVHCGQDQITAQAPS